MTGKTIDFFEDILKANLQWLNIMSSREWQPALVEAILTDSRSKNIVYMGTYEIALNKSVVPSNRKHPQQRHFHHDLIFIDTSPITGVQHSYFHPTQQSQFSTMDDFIRIRETPVGYEGVYFLAELHPDETNKNPEVHWNVLFIDRTRPKIITIKIFDPAVDIEDVKGYDFHSVPYLWKAIFKHYEKNNVQPIERLKCVTRPQRYCQLPSDIYGVDTFCQTWCLCQTRKFGTICLTRSRRRTKMLASCSSMNVHRTQTISIRLKQLN